MDAIIDGINGKGFGTFKFQYSRHSPVHPNPRFIPRDNKQLAEKILGSFFCKFLAKDFKSKIENFRLNPDDSHKKADVLFIENGIDRKLQITQLQFTRYETRKVIALEKNKLIADYLSLLVHPAFPIIVNIFPNSDKTSIPLSNKKRGKTKVEAELIKYLVITLKSRLPELTQNSSPLWLNFDTNKLSPYFRRIVINPVPPNCYPRFYGRNNIYVNYEIDNVAFELADAESAIDEVFTKKNNSSAELLLIWADDFELAGNKRQIGEKLQQKFINSSFDEIYFMTFSDNVALFTITLELWPLKVYSSRPIAGWPALPT